MDADRWERNAVRRELDLVPPRAETAIGASVGKVIDRGDRFREHARVPVPDAKDEAADGKRSLARLSTGRFGGGESGVDHLPLLDGIGPAGARFGSERARSASARSHRHRAARARS